MRGEDLNDRSPHHTPTGSPPHARGRRCNELFGTNIEGITPACAGKTLWCTVFVFMRKGSPPHARGRLCSMRPGKRSRGITPACAGKTKKIRIRDSHGMDHPRMRGEDMRSPYASTNVVGSPPHARGRRRENLAAVNPPGITPACAGKTRLRRRGNGSPRDHPRMRGEDVTEGKSGDTYERITPACAGKTLCDAGK